MMSRAVIEQLASAAEAAWRKDSRWDAVAGAVAVLVAEEFVTFAESALRASVERGYTPEQTAGWLAAQMRARFGQPRRRP